jgi:hypothetical protein
MADTLTISKQIFLPNLAAGSTYDIDTSAAFGYTITKVRQIQTSSGSVTAAIKINGTAVTFSGPVTSFTVNTSAADHTASSGNSVSAGDRVTLEFSSNSGATNINLTLEATRTAVSSVTNSDGSLTISPTSGDVVASVDTTAWTAYTPTLSAVSGTFTTASATGRYKTLGKTTFIEIVISITNKGTAASGIEATLPNTAGSGQYALTGRESALTGKSVMGLITGGATQVSTITYYDYSDPIANGASITVSGVYENT